MREILFRGKRVDNEQWLEGSLVNNVFFHADTKGAIPYIINPYEYEEYDCMEDIGELAVEVAPETVGQFTGLLDKHGRKIFEGDIVKATYDCGPAGEIERIVEVVFDSFGTNLQDWIFKEDGYLPEVIGTIHDNPELVEVTE